MKKIIFFALFFICIKTNAQSLEEQANKQNKDVANQVSKFKSSVRVVDCQNYIRIGIRGNQVARLTVGAGDDRALAAWIPQWTFYPYIKSGNAISWESSGKEKHELNIDAMRYYTTHWNYLSNKWSEVEVRKCRLSSMDEEGFL